MQGFFSDPLALFLVLVSPAVGSFLGVLADRLPRGQDVLRAPSACRSCQRRLTVPDLIPLLSYLGLRGRCRSCQTPIPLRLFLIEAGALFLAFWAVIVTHTPLQLGLGTLFLWLLLALAATDAQWMRLPDVLTGLLALCGLALAGGDPARGLADGLLGAAIGAGGFALLRFAYQRMRGREGLGLGDVKLMVGIGAGVGPLALPMLLLLAALGALIWAFGHAVLRGVALGAQTAVPFGSFLSMAAAGLWLWLA